MNTVSSQFRNTNSASNQATQFRASSKGNSSLAAKFDNISFTPPATLKQNFTKVAEQHTKAIREVATQGVGFVKGVGEVIGETASGIYTLGKNSAATYIDIVGGGKLDLADKIISATTGHKIERPECMPNRQRGVERLEQSGKVLQGVVENPKVLWQTVADPIKEDWNAGRYGEAVGRGTAEVAGIFLGSKGMDKLSVANKAAKTVPHLDDAASVYNKEHNFLSQNLPPVGTLLTKQERLKIYINELMEAPAAKNADEAFSLLDRTMTKIEDAYSGVKAVENPGLAYEGRMYAPRADYTTKQPDGSIHAITAGNIVKILPDGTINFHLKDRLKPDQIGNLVFTKQGDK